MIISWKQTFHAMWTLRRETGTAKYDVTVEIEGPTRVFMTDVAPIMADIAALEGRDLSKTCGRSSLESVVLHIQKLIESRLTGGDHLKRLYIFENDMFGAEIGGSELLVDPYHEQPHRLGSLIAQRPMHTLDRRIVEECS